LTASLTLVVMAGLPGSGKSTLALALGRALGWPVLDKDTLKSTLLAAGMEDLAAGRTSYDLFYALARDLFARQRLCVILDSPTFYPRQVETSVALAREANAALKVVLCLADSDVRAPRIAMRQRVASQPGAIVDAEDGDGLRRFAHLPADTLTVRTERPLAELLAEVRAYVAT
jgi:predicted kinase